MAYDNDQNEPRLPGGDKSIRRSSANHLPRYFRTSYNTKFLSSTLDQLIQPGVAEKLNGYVGRKSTKAFLPSDNYIGDISSQRENYQLEPATIIKDNLGNLSFYKDYNDYINTLKNLGGSTNNHSNLNSQEFYSWNPHIDWDKFTNFREYYWLPSGPDSIAVAGQSTEVESTYTVSLKDNADNLTYLFSPDGLTNNPSITLYRGQKYKFDVDVPGHPIAFATRKSWKPGEAVIVETTDGVRSAGVFDAILYDQDGTAYDAGGFIVDPVSQGSVELGEATNTSLIYDTGVSKVDEEGNTVANVYLEKGIIEFTVPDDAPEKLYYISKNDPNVSGFIYIRDIVESTSIDVDKEIIGKKTYKTSSGFDISNGMKLNFVGNVTPEKYASGEWYVEGVGDKIKLIQQEDLATSGVFTDNIDVEFDGQGFDFYPFSEALGFPANKDYIVINRSSVDGNLWSRYNRWFHKSVIEKTAEINQTVSNVDQSARAKRPIIEFEAGIKLINFGTKSKTDVDLVDTQTKDIFSTIEGSTGYNIDGVNLSNGMRVLFTADTDELVKGKIYKVNFINFRNTVQISLTEEEDSTPLLNETVLVKSGNTYNGSFFYFNGSEWKTGQAKTAVNQQPQFEMYDADDVSFVDTTKYDASTFTGNKIFSYEIGNGNNDTELGFPLTYRIIENVGDITFNFDLLKDSFNYQEGTTLLTKPTDSGYLRIYSDRETYANENGFITANTDSNQNVIKQYIFDNTTNDFYIDVYDDLVFSDKLWHRIYLNNVLQRNNIDYILKQDANSKVYVNFTNSLNLDDVIIIKTRADYPKNENGYYEIPSNLEKNPLNENLSQFTLGEVNDHVATIVEESINFDGIFPGTSNLRDIGKITNLGRKFIKSSGPINLSLYHLLTDDSNIVKSLRYARREYGKFKRQFLEVANKLGYEGPTKQHVDLILKEMNKDKTSSMPFYFSDMIPQGGFIRTEHVIEDTDEQFFPLSQVFSLSTASIKAVQVYQNATQLIHNRDYTFNNEGFVVVTATKAIGDKIEIYEYDSTNGSYMPPTPTKLGLYPAYEPQIYLDTTITTPANVIEGHDGSKFVAFNDFRDNLLLELEKRIYNNIKVSYDTNILDIHDFVGGLHRKTKFTKHQIDKSMTPDFLQWNQLVDGDYVVNNTFSRDNQFSFNYAKTNYPTGEKLPGFWRQAFIYAYDTDRPHTHPWEMLGFNVKPSWWETTYGPAPYTRNNEVLWSDLEQGIIREPDKQLIIKSKYARPGLTNTIPTDDEGQLLSPVACNLSATFDVSAITDSWTYGDGGPVESAWRRGSEYPFALITSWVLNQPNKIFSVGFDRLRQKRSIANQIVYGDTEKQIQLGNIVFPNTINDDTQVFTSGLVNYISNYMASDSTASYTKYKSNLQSIINQIGVKLGGYSDKEKFKFILDSRTPTNEGNVFIPQENYELFLNTSSPLESISYSGVIVEKQADGYVVRGYDYAVPEFSYYKPIPQQNDPVVVVGGVSENFVNFSNEKTYVEGQIVLFNNEYYRATETHTSGTSLDSGKFAKLPTLPIVGGRRATFPKVYEQNVSKLNYGDKLTTIQDVVNFLLGYGKYLTDIGFVFEDRIDNSNVVSDWNASTRQFMYWTTQNWSAGAIISLSPGSKTLKLKSSYSVVDNLFETFYGYSILKVDGKKLKPEFVKIQKGLDNECIVKAVNTADGIFAARFPLVQKEHIALLDNKTVFGDVIYDTAPGYRQERIKVLGYRTDNWNGSLNIPGFIYDNARPTEWESWKDYAIGDLVKYKEFFYSANEKIAGSENFIANQWVRLSEEPKPGLYANFDYKINQFADYYDLDSDNFDVEQQRLAQHLIGYQKRQYLENIINDDVSQYKFYQGFILDKGTKNSLTKLFDALASANQDSLEFYEEWAIKDGQYGASEGFEEVEYLLDEKQFRLDPQPIELVDQKTSATDLVYRILPYETYLKSKDYDHKPFPTKYIAKGYTKDSGYVNPQDIDARIGSYNDILSQDFTTLPNQGYVWVGNVNETWNVYQHVATDYKIESIESGTGEFTILLGSTPLDIDTGEILGITDVITTSFDAASPDDSTVQITQTENPLQGFFKVKSVSLNKVVFETNENIAEIENCTGVLTKFISCRKTDIIDANKFAEKEMDPGEKLWIDNDGSGRWVVLQNQNRYTELQEISNTELGTGHEYGKSLSVDDRNVLLAVGAPEVDDGKVYIYNRASNSLNYTLQQVIEADTSIADSGQNFGASVSLSGDGQFLLVGAPKASNVKTNFKGDFDSTQSFAAGDIVREDDSLWSADVAIERAVDNIEFSSFDSVAQINYQINNDTVDREDIPVLLTGDYPFKNITTDHFLIRAPKDMYEGSGVGDQIYLRWNNLSNANQDQIDLVSTSPFGGSNPYITKEYLESADTHTIDIKVDAILFVDASNNIPLVGDTVTTQGATGTVVYTHNEEAQLTIYVGSVNGEFPSENSLFINGNDFVGEYERVGPAETIDTSSVYGGYWFIRTSNPYPIGNVNNDPAYGLVYKDIITAITGGDSTSSTRYYYQSLDYSTSLQNSESVINSYIQSLSFEGSPGPEGNTDPILSSKFVVRVPEALSSVSSPGDEVELYVNNLPDITTTLEFTGLVSLGEGETLTQLVTGATCITVESVTNSTTVKVQRVTGNFDTINLITASSSGTLASTLGGIPVTDKLEDPSSINLAYSITNKKHTIDDIWDGYIAYRNTKFLNGEPFEPLVGQTVRDKSTLATAEVAFYQRSLNDVVIFVKNVSGNFSKGNQFGDNAEIEFLPFISGPDPDVYGRAGIYTVPRVMGQIQRVSLGYTSQGIGKLFVFDAGINVPYTGGSFLFDHQLGAKKVTNILTGDFLYLEPDNNFEYWLYKEENVLGIPRPANRPSSSNLDWTETFKIPTSGSGDVGSFTNEGIYYIYRRTLAGNFLSLGSYVAPERKTNNYVGQNVHIAKSTQDVYRGYVHAPGDGTQVNPGKIYFIKNGTENNVLFNWEYAKNKKFKGEFSDEKTYFIGDIVYLDNKLYNAITNINPGSFDTNQWDSTDDLIDYVGYVPNDTGLIVQNDSSYSAENPFDSTQIASGDSSVLDQGSLYEFASSFDTTPNGEVLVVNAKYGNDKPNLAVIYRIIQGQYLRSQQIAAPSDTEAFAEKVAISNDGKLLAVSAPYDDSQKTNQGKVYIYSLNNGLFEYSQTLLSPLDNKNELFGSVIDFDGNRLLVNARNGDNTETTTFDFYSGRKEGYVLDATSNPNSVSTTFDKEFTKFKENFIDQGSLYIYENVNGNLLYGQQLFYKNENSPVYYFGRNTVLKNNHVYVGLPTVSSNSLFTGTVVDFRLPERSNIYNRLRESKDPVNLEKIKRVILYNRKTNKLLTYLDYIDPIQGKIAGPAEQNLSYKTYYDPASYTVGTGSVVVSPTNSWGPAQVGQLWWNLTNAKFINPYQGNSIYSSNNWSSLFDGNTIDVYEWVESTVLPSKWDQVQSTSETLDRGISGTSLYGDTAYATKQVYDKVSQSLQTYYYFWVKNKKTIPNKEFRTMSSFDVANLISDPKAQGYRFAAFLSNNSFTIYNCDNLLSDDDVAFSVQYWTIDNQQINIHNQYQIITEGLSTSKPNRDIERKWFDSLIGYDEQNKIVPAPDLSPKQKYGILNSPRQSWFVNKQEALKQVIERANIVLKKNLIVDDKSLLKLQLEDPAPTAISRKYDTTVETVAELEFIGVAKAQQASVQLVIEDGVIKDINVLNAGRGYLVAPTYTINGTGSGAEIEFTINNLGVITSATVVKGGSNYSPTDTITVRKYTVLVKNDTSIQGKWALYERDSDLRSWLRIASQSYDVKLFWEYVDWYAENFNEFTETNFVIDNAYELQGLDDELGDIIKINSIGSGGWLLLRKIDVREDVDYTVNYETIGRQNGTIQFKNTLYDTQASATGFDIISFDTEFFDSVPSIEIRQILNAIKQDLFTEELSIEYNNLFFASLRYVFAEQGYVDWAFKTSFVKAKHNVGQLREDITFNNDSLPSYEDYLEEVKPFKTKLREYISAYEKIEDSNSRITDFDLQPSFDDDTKSIKPQDVKVVNNNLIGVNDKLETYPFKNWKDNVGFIVKEIQIADGGKAYTQAPQILLTGGGGSGATAISKLGADGKITKIEITNPGSGYLSAPLITINGTLGEGGRDAKCSVIIGNSLPRSLLNVIKFDRVSGNYLITYLEEAETFIGTGSRYVFDLKWPMDLQSTQVEVVVDNVVLLRSEYSYENVKDTSKTYTRYNGRIILRTPPSNNTSVQVNYKKAVSLLTAQDRINLAYNPSTGQFAKDLGQLMDGVDYGGVEVKSFDFGGPTGWDTGPWFTSEYDTYDTTYEDEVFKLDGSTITLTLNKPLESGVTYNLYKNGVRLDDPDWVDDSTQFTNPNAIMRSIIGDGTQTVIELDELGIPTAADDEIVIRKSTSDGSFLPLPGTYDTLIEGGGLQYDTAQGILAEEINIDGDGFFTPTNSGGPDEQLPGRVFDAVDIKVYERPTTGASKVVSRNYTGDGSTKSFAIGTKPVTKENLFVKVDFSIKKLETDYTINYDTEEVEFTTAPVAGTKVNFVTLEYSGANVLDIDEFIGDGSTGDFLTNVTYTNDMSSLVTIDGETVAHTLVRSNETYASADRVVIRFAEPPALDKVVRFAIFEGQVQNFSTVSIDEFESDGSTTAYTLTQTPFTANPTEWFTIVKINDTILNAGYNQKFTVSDIREYQLKLWQVPVGSVTSDQIRVYLNGNELTYLQDFDLLGAGQFDPALPLGQQSGSTVILNQGIGESGDILRVYILGWDDSTQSGGDYRFGYYNESNEFVKTPGVLYINKNYALGDKITVYQFSNHDSQGIERQNFDVVERTTLSPGVNTGSQIFVIDGSTTDLNLLPALDPNKSYAVFLNNVRKDDPNFDGSSPVANVNATCKTITGSSASTVNILDDFGFTTSTDDVVEIREIGGTIEPDEGTADWYELRQLKAGYINLRTPAVDDQYVWVVKNGNLLNASVDYAITADKTRIKLVEELDDNDVIETFHFANDTLAAKFGWSQFKDILNRNVYKRLDGSNNVRLVEPLNWYDKYINVENSESLPDPVPGSKYPAIVYIEGERIEYFRKDGSYLKQLRRGTLGTGVKPVYDIGTELYDISQTSTVPYKDETLTTIFTADGTSNTYELDFTPADPSSNGTAIDTFEVFVAGRRLRKTTLESYELNSDARTNYATEAQSINQDSPEGDVTLPAEFSLQNGNELVLLETPGENQKVIVVRKQGKLWNSAGTQLSKADSDISRFLRSVSPDLPG